MTNIKIRNTFWRIFEKTVGHCNNWEISGGKLTDDDGGCEVAGWFNSVLWKIIRKWETQAVGNIYLRCHIFLALARRKEEDAEKEEDEERGGKETQMAVVIILH